MFTGIIEAMGRVLEKTENQDGLDFVIESPISHELKIDQSVSHDGICLTVVQVKDNTHTVQAIRETLQKTNISKWQQGTVINLERSMPAHGRFDGHIVQGHVDCVGVVNQINQHGGQLDINISHDPSAGITVEKGSICVNGISLTVVNSQADSFSLTIIPYTREHTNLKQLEVGNLVNLEFDIIGKYLLKMRNS